MTVRHLACLTLAALATTGFGQLDGSDYVKVEVKGPQTSELKDGVLLLRVDFSMDAGWHIYWKNPGDSGAPPTLDWSLPTGFEVVKTRWQAPHRIISGGIVSYGYEVFAALLVEVKTPPNFKSGDKFAYTLETNYLVCKDICLPGSAKVSGEFEVPDSGSRKKLPMPLVGRPDTATFKSEEDSIILTFDLSERDAVEISSAYFFPANEATIDHAAEQKWILEGKKLTLTVKRSQYATKPFSAVVGVLVLQVVAPVHANQVGPRQLAIEYTKSQENQ